MASPQLATFNESIGGQRRGCGEVAVTFLLVDWSCRESYHFLDYLQRQTVPREEYEILWIEYYSRQSPELFRRIAAAEAEGRHPDVDAYLTLGMPEQVYYHKHLMYNTGLLLARGRMVCICDSDAMARPELVESILDEFQRDENIVLHLDEVRNNDRSFHPFRYPSFEEVTGPGSANWIDGRPSGLVQTLDPLHTRNYGACLCARRDDLVAIGGADMHRDYLGHICGPYEMTFRLVNAGRREVWHASQWLYHVWHPGQAGDRNYAGPHDGMHVSTTALEARASGRVRPLVECPAIAALRAGETDEDELLARLVEPAWLDDWDAERLEGTAKSYSLGTGRIRVVEGIGHREQGTGGAGRQASGVRRQASGAVAEVVRLRGLTDVAETGEVTRDVSSSFDAGERQNSRELSYDARTAVQPPAGRPTLFGYRLGRVARLRLFPLVLWLLWRQFKVRLGARALNPRLNMVPSSRFQVPGFSAQLGTWNTEPGTRAPRVFFGWLFAHARRVRSAVAFLQRMWNYDRHLLRVCWLHLCYAVFTGRYEMVLYGDGEAARILYKLARFLPIEIRAVCPFGDVRLGLVSGVEHWSEERLRSWSGAVISATLVNTSARLARLRELGIPRERVIVLE